MEKTKKIKQIVSLSSLVLLWVLPWWFNEVEVHAFEWSPGPIHQFGFMETKSLYLMHHLMAVIPVVFFGLVLDMVAYRKKALQYMKASLVVAPVFWAWDAIFNGIGVWTFNPQYTLGAGFLGLPWEEWSWFLVIPFCSFFIHSHVEKRIKVPVEMDRWLPWILLLVAVGVYAMGWERLYTSWSAGSVVWAMMMVIIWKMEGIAIFVVSFVLNLMPMYIFNGMLTGLFTQQALVVYNPLEFSGIRIGTYPMEDIGFGFSYLLGIFCVSKLLKPRVTVVYEA